MGLITMTCKFFQSNGQLWPNGTPITFRPVAPAVNADGEIVQVGDFRFLQAFNVEFDTNMLFMPVEGGISYDVIINTFLAYRVLIPSIPNPDEPIAGSYSLTEHITQTY